MGTSIKFTGLASGMDTESIVNAMVMPYKNKVDNSKKQETLLEWKKDAYKEVSSKIYKFYTKTAGDLRLESTFNKKVVTASSNGAIDIDKNSTVPAGTHKVTVSQIAEGAMLSTKGIQPTKSNVEVDKNTKLVDLGIEVGGVLKVKANDGKEVEIKIEDKTTINDLQTELKNALPDANVNFDTNAKAFFISSKETGDKQSISIEASYADNSDTKARNMMRILGFGDQTKIYDKGDDAKVTYNGVEVSSSSNKVSINGLTFTIKGTTKIGTDAIGDVHEAITISSIEDTDGMFETIKSFVDEYNTLIDELNNLLNASSSKGYEPLTDEEKEAMSDKEIEQWEKKIKDSLLRNDPVLKEVLSSMRTAIGGTFNGNEFGSLSGIGITSGSYNENGKLYINEDKLKAAITQNANSVVELLSGSKTVEEKNETGEVTKKTTTVGLIDRLYDTLKSKFSSISNVKTSTSLYSDLLWNKKITNQATETDKWQDRLEKMEELYYKKFTAMEKLMSTMNSQASSITSLLGGTQ